MYIVFVGGVNILIACFGMIFGGCVVTKKKLSPLACIQMMVIVMAAISLISISGLFWSCGNTQIVDLTQNEYVTRAAWFR